MALEVKSQPANTEDRDVGLIPRLGRAPWGDHGHPLQYSCLENPTDRGTWQTIVHRVARVGHNWKDLAHTHTTAKAGETTWSSEQNATDAVPTPEVAATTRLWVGTGYCTNPARSLNSLVPPMDPRSGAKSSRRAQDIPQIATTPSKSLLLQAHPGASQLWLPYSSLSPAQVNKRALISLGIYSLMSGWGTDCGL